MPPTIQCQLLDPMCEISRGSQEAAGWDARASLAEPLSLFPMQRLAISLGIKLALPMGWECQVRPRSGLAIKNGITVLNSPGTIDSDYRGVLQVILINLSNNTFIIEPHMRICQLVFSPVHSVNLVEVTSVSETQRGEGGFGSTGLSA